MSLYRVPDASSSVPTVRSTSASSTSSGRVPVKAPVQAADRGRDRGRDAVTRLCARVADDLAYYKSAELDETSCRQRFIDPLFAALGWDVADEDQRGLNSALRHAQQFGHLVGGQQRAGHRDERLLVVTRRASTEVPTARG